MENDEFDITDTPAAERAEAPAPKEIPQPAPGHDQPGSFEFDDWALI
ncbi:MAG: hypothetical protein AAF771_17495 [Pseudomonadota bacterium]